MKKNRRGSMLIQQLILIALSGMVMMVAIQIIHRTLSFAGDFQNQSNANRSVSLLVRQFRFDGHDASSIAFRDDKSLVFRATNGNQVTYRTSEGYIEREEANVNTNAFKRDRYLVGSHRIVSLQQTDKFFCLVIEANASQQPNSRWNHKSLRVEIPREEGLQQGGSHGQSF